MLFEVHIKNLGKLTDAKIRVGKFTVFAGPNNTGKSYVSKALYSIFGAMNANHLEAVMARDVGMVKRIVKDINRDRHLAPETEGADIEILSAVEKLQGVIDNISINAGKGEFAAIEKALPDIAKIGETIHQDFIRLQDIVYKIIDRHDASDNGFNPVFYVTKNDLGRTIECVKKLQKNAKKSPEEIILEGLEAEVCDNFLDNFQVSRLSNLYSAGGGMNFIISGIGEISAGNVNRMDNVVFNLKDAGLHQLQKFSRVLYLESPVHWRMKTPLDRVRKTPRHRFIGKKEITGVPKYVYDMYDNLDAKYPGKMICPEVFERLTGRDVLNGKIIVPEVGNEFLFQEGNHTYPLHLAATGVANLGMLALLMESNFLDENTFLFVDEPEANLHPAWQVEMVKALYELSKEGVNVVIATHSADIAKWLEVFAKKYKEEAEQNIELNHFRNGTVETNGGDVLKRINAVQEDLANPYFKMFVSGL